MTYSGVSRSPSAEISACCSLATLLWRQGGALVEPSPAIQVQVFEVALRAPRPNRTDKSADRGTAGAGRQRLLDLRLPWRAEKPA